jgi:glycosyltransferase involved in cell wall biosynthesis
MTLNGNLDSPGKTARKDAELRQANLVTVASSFTQRTLEQAPDFTGTVVRIPYGAPRLDVSAPERIRSARTEKLRVLFVGSLGQRKGLSYLFDAVRKLGSAVELTVIGSRPLTPCPALDQELARVRWIASCSHREVLAEMAANDVFVFPSLFEGFGLVLLEAMAMGLPIITTPHTAGPDLITDGVEGFIVPIRSSQAITERLERLRLDPELRVAMSEQARVRARQFTWENYGHALAESVSAVLVRT